MKRLLYTDSKTVRDEYNQRELQNAKPFVVLAKIVMVGGLVVAVVTMIIR